MERFAKPWSRDWPKGSNPLSSAIFIDVPNHQKIGTFGTRIKTGNARVGLSGWSWKPV